MRKHLFFILSSLGLLILIFGSVLAGFALNEIYFLKPTANASVVSITIPSGASQKQISRMLHERGLISSQWLFDCYGKYRHLTTRFKQGTFAIPVGTDMRRIVSILTSGDAGERTLTFIEGWTLRDMARTLAVGGISSDRFFAVSGTPPGSHTIATRAQSFESDFSFLKVKPAAATLEGFLFPDTYRVFSSASAEDVVRKMLENFSEKVGMISYHDLIVASIVEREVATPADRRSVADIFKRRLAAGMPLEADSTVNYVTGKNMPALSAADRAIDSPYNTYRHAGLPPGPISNPGFDAIDAVRHPTPNAYWYFLTDRDGKVHYARTLDEHNRNKTKYFR